jgi:hypothetical protein
MSQHTMDKSTNLSNDTNAFNVQNNYTVTDNRSPLLKWLSPLEPELQHQDIRECRIDNVGEWLLQTKEFRRWHGRNGEGECDKVDLSCYRGPGIGKIFMR